MPLGKATAMIIAFEGSDKRGIKASAANIGHLAGYESFAMTKESHAKIAELFETEKGLVHAFDGVSWVSEMASGLDAALSGNVAGPTDWAFLTPDTHLVVRQFDYSSAPDNLKSLNEVYQHVTWLLIDLNEQRNFEMFKTVTLLNVDDFGDIRVTAFSSPVYDRNSIAKRLVHDDDSLLELLQHEESNR